MKRIATQTATKGKKSVTLDIYSSDNILTFADVKENYYKIIHVQDHAKAIELFYKWTLQMHNISTEITLYD